jgi:hypothetical protein
LHPRLHTLHPRLHTVPPVGGCCFQALRMRWLTLPNIPGDEWVAKPRGLIVPNAILDNEEPLLSMAEAARIHNRCTAGITRWILRGCTGADGLKIRLEGVRVGHKWFTSAAALRRYFEQLSLIGDAIRADHFESGKSSQRRTVDASQSARR